MRRALVLLMPLLLAACAAPGGRSPLGGLFREPEPEGPPPLPLAVQQALPPGVPASVVLTDAAGCYLYSIERTDPPSGYPLRDALGNPICEGGASPAVAAAPALPPAPISPIAAETAAAAPAEPPAPEPPALDLPRFEPPTVAPAAAAPVTVAPVTELPDLPTALPPPGGALVPGSITPPAPLAPLN